MSIFKQILKKKPPKIIVKQEIDYDKLAHAIVKAQKIVEADESEKNKEQEKQELKRWHKSIGIKDYNDDNSNFFVKKLHKIRNGFSVLFHIIFFKKKYAVSDIVTFSLLQLGASGVFSVCSLLFLLLSIYFVLMSFMIIQESKPVFNFQPIYLLWAFSIFLFSRLFKIASIEVEKLNDKNYVIAIFSSMTCFFAMVFSLIALFRGGDFA